MGTRDTRGALAVEDLLKIVLVLAIAWLALAVARAVFGILRFFVAVIGPLIALAIIVLIVLWLRDRR